MGATVTAVIVLKERQIVAAFRSGGATSAASAATPASLGVPEHGIFRRLRNRAVLREARPGLFYLDEPSWEALGRLRRRIAFVVVVAALALALALALVTLQAA